MFFLTRFRCKLKRLLPGYCLRQFHPQSIMIRSTGQEKLLLFTFLSKPQTPTSHESKCIAYFWCFPTSVLLLTPLFPLPPTQTARAYPLAHPSATCSHTKTVACFLSAGRGCFYCDSILAERANSSAVWLRVCVCVCVFVCVHSHVLFNMFVSLPAQLLNFFGGRRLLRSNSCVYVLRICNFMCITPTW